MKKIILALCLVALSIVPGDARFPRGGSSSNAVAFTHVPIGGAGAVIGVSSVPFANLLLARTDQYNCYISISNSQWTPLITAPNSPQGITTSTIGVAAITSVGAPSGGQGGNGGGSGGCVAAPSAPTNIWVEINGGIFVSTDSGVTFNGTCYPAQSDFGPSNLQATKNLEHIIAVDPANPNIVYMGTGSNGVYVTYNKGVSCTHLTAVGNSTSSGNHLIAFDTSGNTTTTCPGSASICTKNVYVSTNGTGVYKVTDAGFSGTWTLTTSTPTAPLAMRVDPFGNVWYLENRGDGLGILHKYNGSAWSTSSLVSTFGIGVDINPNNCSLAATCEITVVNGGGPGASGTARSGDGGATWNSTSTLTASTSDVPWLAAQINGGFGFFPAGAAYDNSGHVYTGGEGTFFTTPPSSGSTDTWTSKTLGIEEMLSSNIVTSTAMPSKVAFATWDVNCFVQLAMPYTSLPSNPTNRGCLSPNGTGLQHAYNIAVSATDPSFFVALVDSQGGYGGGTYINYSGTSTDAGVTWSALTAPSTVSSGGYKGGCIAAASNTNFLWLPTDGVGGTIAPFFTTNAGTSWTQITVSGIAASGWGYVASNPSIVCAPDSVPGTNPNTFYLYNWNNGVTGFDAIVKCTSGGASCAIQSSPGLSANSQFTGVLKAVPGNAGHLFLSSRGNAPVDGLTGELIYSVDGGAHTTTVSLMKSVYAFGFGAAFPGHTYPAIVVVGIYNGTYGIWRSIDWDGAKTWQQIGTYPKNLAVAIADVRGDQTIPNVFYYVSNSGAFCSAPSITYCNGGT